MALPTTLRPRQVRPLRLAAAACLAGLISAAAALLASGPAAPVPSAAQCLPPLFDCPTPTPTPQPTQSHTATPRPTQSHTPTPAPPPPHPTSPGSTPQPPQPNFPPPPSYIPPANETPLPTLPPPSPGAPPQPPALEVQKIDLELASEPASKPGAQVLVQATLEAQRDSDTYSVPGAPVSFSITSQPGAGAFVDPSQQSSGDTGVVLVTVQTSDIPGDTVVHASSGSAAADFTVHADPPTPTPRATTLPGAAPAVAAPPGNNPRVHRPLLVASLSALLAAMAGSYIAALILGRLPNPLQRRVWGRRGVR